MGYESLYLTATKALDGQIKLNNKLQAENERLDKKNTHLIGQNIAAAKAVSDRLNQWREANAEIERLKNALGLYGCHSEKCRAEEYPEAWHCICGLDQALKDKQ